MTEQVIGAAGVAGFFGTIWGAVWYASRLQVRALVHALAAIVILGVFIWGPL